MRADSHVTSVGKKDISSVTVQIKQKQTETHKAKNVTCEHDEDSSESAFVAREDKMDKDKMTQQVEWLINSGASKHITCHEEILQDYQQFPKSQSST